MTDATTVITTQPELDLAVGLPFEDWQKIGGQLQTMTRNLPWYWGDWLNFGQRAYGEKYTTAVETFGLNLQTAKIYAMVAARFDKFNRLNVSWSHHLAVAGVADPEKRRSLLASAMENKWSKLRLRQEVGRGTEKTTLEEWKPVSNIDISLLASLVGYRLTGVIGENYLITVVPCKPDNQYAFMALTDVENGLCNLMNRGMKRSGLSLWLYVVLPESLRSEPIFWHEVNSSGGIETNDEFFDHIIGIQTDQSRTNE